MKKAFIKEQGFTLIEVLASIVILTIMFSVLSSFFVNSASYSNSFDKKLNSVQLSKSLLEKFQAEGFEAAHKRLQTGSKSLSSAEINSVLELSEDFVPVTYEAKIEYFTISRQDEPVMDPALLSRFILIKVTVSNKDGKSEAELEGYVRK
ncbi:type IV pilus modification PilV family protein [Metabacillus idriensis]|uniref:type IV pilus modification PilV family protein n=1 Tax=Metabacillus idriensis TaxID=324768 RepID=UPI001749C4C2|nr:type II secretion system protein [Metabacillus idriensis]